MDEPCPDCGSVSNASRWGHEVSGIYDGVLFWSCGICGHAWPRKFNNPRLDQESAEQVERYRKERWLSE